LLKDDGGGNHVTSTFDDGAPAWATPRRQKLQPDHLYSSTLIRGIVKNQNPKRVCGRPVIIKNRANGELVSFQCRSALLVSPAWRIAATTGTKLNAEDRVNLVVARRSRRRDARQAKARQESCSYSGETGTVSANGWPLAGSGAYAIRALA
jgi:hypothetical protein